MFPTRAFLAILSAGIVLGGTSLALATPSEHPNNAGELVLFPAGSVVRIVGFSPLSKFTVPPSGGRLVGTASVDHFVFLMAWTNGTPLPECADFLGYLGSNWTYSPEQTLAPGSYEFGPVCGGFANLSITDSIAVLWT